VVGGEGGDGADLAGGGIGQRDEVGAGRARRSAAGAVDGVEQPGGVSGVLRGGEELGKLGEGEGAGAGVGVIVMAGACGARLGDDPGGREGRGGYRWGVLR